MQTRTTHGAKLFLLLLAVVSILAFTGRSNAQDTNASLSGSTLDPSNAAVPGVALTVTNTATGFQSKTVSNEAGEYTFRNLTPGIYDLSAAANGFQSTVQKGIELSANQSGRAELHLSLGQESQTVEVNGETSSINYDNPTISGGVSPEVLEDLPLVVSGAPRSSVSVAILMPGVTTGGGGNAFNTRINGGIVTGDEALVDGATAMEGFMNQSGMVALQTDFGMSPDITSEVKVLTANYDAAYGNSTSGQIIIQTKSGGERFHGAAYDYIRNAAFNAFQYGAASNIKKPEDSENDYGANIGGPISIPHLHLPALLKGYFYFNWEGFKDHGGANSATLSIASINDRAGNFGGAGTQLYYPNDPTKYGALAGTAIPGNIIDPSYEDPVAKSWLAALPTPTSSGETNNYFIPHSGQGSLTNSENVYFARVDLTVGGNDHLYYTYWWQYSGVNTQSDLPVALSTAEPANPENAPIQRINWEHTFSDKMTNHFTFGYLNRNEGYYSLNAGASLPSVPGVGNTSYLPTFNFGNGYSQLGSTDGPRDNQNLTTRGTYALNEVITRVIKTHTLTGGFEYRLAGTSIHSGANQGGTFTFSPDTTGNTACTNTEGCPGNSIASFYLGAAATSNVEYINVLAKYPRQPGYAFHLSDNWRVNPKLTLTYGLRWDYIAPFHEKFDNASFFDPFGANPGAVTAAGQELPGRLAFAGTKWGAASYGAQFPEIPFKSAYAPRVGVAYTINDKTVVRAGYGIYFGQAFYPGWGAGLSLDGFNKNLNLSETAVGSGKLPANYLSSGISASQVGSTQSINSAFDNGQSPLYRPLDGNKRPYSSQWNFTVENQLPDHFVVGLSYVGTKGTHLPSALSPLNILNPYNPGVANLGTDLGVSYNSTGGPATFAKDGINVPYVGWASQLTGCAPTIAQALTPFPQFCGVLQGVNEEHGTSIYNSFQAHVEKHLSHGLYVLGSFTLQKLFTNGSDSVQSTNDVGVGNQGNDGQISPYNPARTHAIAADNVPITLSLTGVYELPFGKGKQFLKEGALVNTFAGNWKVSPITRYEYGTPFSFSSSSCPTQSLVPQFREGCIPGLLSGQQPLLHSRNGFDPSKHNGLLINPAAFENDFSAFGYTGVGPAVTTIYGPSFKDTDIALTKTFYIRERANFQFTTNFFNAFNNHYLINSQGGNYGGPSVAFVTDVAAPNNTFGTWNGATSSPRSIQFAGRLQF